MCHKIINIGGENKALLIKGNYKGLARGAAKNNASPFRLRPLQIVVEQPMASEFRRRCYLKSRWQTSVYCVFTSCYWQICVFIVWLAGACQTLWFSVCLKDLCFHRFFDAYYNTVITLTKTQPICNLRTPSDIVFNALLYNGSLPKRFLRKTHLLQICS